MIAFLRHLEALRTRVVGMVARVVVRSANDGPRLQTVRVDGIGRETWQAAERFQNYGLSSVPVDGAEAVVVFPMGNRDHPCVVAVDDRAARPVGLAAGDVVLYSRGGARVHLRASDGRIRVESPAAVEVDADTVMVEGATSVELKSGSSRIAVTPAGITLEAPLINVNQAV